MADFWAKALGCQAEDGYEQLKGLLAARGEIYLDEAARFLTCDLETARLLLHRLVEEGLALAPGERGAWVCPKAGN